VERDKEKIEGRERERGGGESNEEAVARWE